MYSMLYRTAEVATARLVDVCLVVSSAERDAATRGPLGWPTQMEVVPNIVEITPADAARAREIRKALGVKDGERIALYLGRLAAGKRIDDLIRAVQQVRAAGHKWHAVIAGEGALRRPLEELARGNGLSDFIHFVGFQQETQNWIAAADCLVHPSSFEAFGVAVAEAMMVGRAVIASDIPSMRELIEPGVTGVLYPCGNVAELSNRLIAFSNDPALLTRMGRAGLERSDRFSAKPVAAAHIAVYLHLLKREGVGA
jgi:glycosyltransferase involved in cell wall biosynthesis